MSAYNSQMGIRSEGQRNTAQSPCTYKSSAVSKFSSIETYGDKLSLKEENTFRLLFENVNGLPPDMGYCHSSWKYKRLRNIISRLQVDAISLAETQINPAVVSSTFSMRNKIFQQKESVSILTNNQNEHLGMRQQGGIFTGITGSTSTVAIASGSDHTGLGRWNWIQLKGQSSSTYIITAYQCVESRTTVGTVFMQRERYLKKHNMSLCPRKHFIQDLVQFITRILEENNKVILSADINEHVIDGVLSRELKNLGMVEAHVKKFNLPGPASHITGRLPIDGVWVSNDVTPTVVSVFPHKFGVGDHRVILVDFNLDQLIQRNVRICTPTMRRLICENKRSVDTYNQLAMNLLTSNKILQRLENLEGLFGSMDMDRWCVKLNRIDEQVTDILLHAEKRCRKLRTGEVEYSPEVSEAAEKWYAWRLALKTKQGTHTNTRELQRLANKWNIDLNHQENIWSLKMNVERSRREYLELKAQHEIHRRRYLERTGRLAKWNKESRKRQYKRCNTTFGKRKMKSISSVEHRDNGVLLQASTKEAVEFAIMQENSNRFRLAYSSPLLEGNLHFELGPSGEGPLSADILGSQEQLRNRPEVEEIFKLFRQSSHLSISSQISTEHWIDHWKCAKERTASSFSGLHFGHYKAHTVQKEIAEIKCKLVNLALLSGQPLMRWTKGVSVMLEKVPGNINVQKLRAILLLEADFNAMHKIIFNNRLIPRIEADNAIPLEVIGGRRSQAATHLALDKKLIADIANVRKLPMATICADATNCYDRVAHPFASLCAQYFGLELTYLTVLFQAIQSMKMFLRTSHGISTNYYSDTIGQPFQGVVQGSGAAPALWLIISIFLVRYLYSKNVTTKLSSPITNAVLPLAALIFVDDTDLYVFNSGADTAEEVVIKAQRLLNTWHEILKFTGGDLKLSKCYWTLQDYEWKQGICKTVTTTTQKLYIVEEGQRKEIPHLAANQTRVLVGVPINLCHEKAQIMSQIKDKTHEYINKLTSSPLKSTDIMFGYQHYWWPSLKYPSPVLSFELNSHVLDKLHTAMLPKLGVMKTFPVVMRGVPAFLGGLNLHLAEVEGFAQSIHHLISLYEANTPTRGLLQILLEYHQLELGLDKQLFSLTFSRFSNLTTETWITSIWKHLSHFNLHLVLPPLALNIDRQDGDEFITEAVIRLGIQSDHRESINRVRIHLKLLLISDLLVYKKNIIKHCFRQGLNDDSYVSSFLWPVSVPSKKDINLWKKFISLISRRDGSLLRPIHWRHTTRRHRQSTAFLSCDKKFVQIIHDGNLLLFRQTRLSNRYTRIVSQPSINFSERVEVELQSNRCRIYASIPIEEQHLQRTSNPHTNHQQLTKWNMQDTTILTLLRSNKCMAIVDGSFFPEHSVFISAHWKFIYEKKIIGSGGFVAKVDSHLQSAYAAELCGGLGILHSIQSLFDKCNFTDKVNFRLGSDCQSALHRFSSQQKVVSFDSKLSYEVREFLRLKHKYIELLTTFKIAGHQDKVKQSKELTFEERVNILCDQEAKILIRNQINIQGTPSFPFSFQSPVLLNRHKQRLLSTESIREELYSQIAAPYLEKKLRITSIDEVDLKFRKRILNTMSASNLIWLSKSFTNFLGTAHQLCRQGLVSTSQCRMCTSASEEDLLHILQCKHEIFQDFRNETISLLQVKILPLLEEDMLPLSLLEWLLDDECDQIDSIPVEVMRELNRISRRNVWFGFLPTIFLQWIKWRYEEDKWLVSFMQLCIKALYELWLERCRIVHESLTSKVQIEDHHHLLHQVRLLFHHTDISISPVLHQYKYRLHSLPTETLRGVAYQLLSDLGIDSTNTPFHNDINKSRVKVWRPITPEIVRNRDQATLRRYRQTHRNKRQREEFEDLVESRKHSTRRKT